MFAYVDAGLHAKAAESAGELDMLVPHVNDPLRVAQMHMNVARLYLTNGDVGAALRSLQRAEDAYRQLDFVVETGEAYLARGYVLARKGRRSAARKELGRALAIFEQSGDEKDLTRTLNELARVERLDGRLTQARDLLERSIALTGSSDTPISAWAHRELGVVLSGLDPSAAEKNFRIAIEQYELCGQPVEMALTYGALGDLMETRGESEARCEVYRAGIQALGGLE